MKYYPVAIESCDEKTAYGVIVPDIAGCFSAGDTLEDALVSVRLAIEAHLALVLEDGGAVPEPSDVSRWAGKQEYRAFAWYEVGVDIAS